MIAWWSLLAALAGPVADASAEEAHPLLPTLARWAQESVDSYVLDGVRPYRATVAMQDREGWVVEATFGAITVDQGWRTRPGRVEVVVGRPERDSSRFHGGSSTLASPRFVIDDHPLAVARDLWLTTDDSFKRAVKQLQIKETALGQLGSSYPPDWSPAEPVVAVVPGELASLEVDTLRALAVEGSSRLRELGGLRNGEVKGSAVTGRYVLATSEGTRLVQPEGHATVYAWADVVRDDGLQLYEYKQWVAGSVDELPAPEVLLAEIEALGRRVLARRDAEPVPYYEGPVLFEGDAAADLFRYLAVPELLGTPPAPREGRTYEQLMRHQARVGRRLLGPGWSIVDDPGGAPEGLAGGFAYDREGVPAQRVELVVDGWVRDLLMSRVPRQDLRASNGHARGDVQGGWEARESVVTVEPDRMLSERKLQRVVARTQRESGQPRILVVRGLQRGRGRAVPAPTDAVWRYPDGREEPVLALDFSRADRRVLRDIVAAGGGPWVRAYLAPDDLGGPAPGRDGLPAVLIAPEKVLISELEAVFPGGTVEPAALPPPPER